MIQILNFGRPICYVHVCIVNRNSMPDLGSASSTLGDLASVRKKCIAQIYTSIMTFSPNDTK